MLAEPDSTWTMDIAGEIQVVKHPNCTMRRTGRRDFYFFFVSRYSYVVSNGRSAW
jgi:hypothetical protein